MIFFLILRGFNEQTINTSISIGHNVGQFEYNRLVETCNTKLREGRTVMLIHKNEEWYYKNKLILGLIAPDDKWVDIVRVLAKEAKKIYLFPASSSGLETEIKLINMNNYHNKTIVFMPSNSSNITNVEPTWSFIRRKYYSQEINFPIYENSGFMYVPNLDFSIKKKLNYKNELKYNTKIGYSTKPLINILNELPILKIVSIWK